ncbi:uncharacterized protein LOC131285210 [Anopheles ziemanni]|uniref:uncharacterized protein LOC131264830 n=1 Tax=Anopheles coustani TaxID=139045 RepID=UPI002658A9A0|nr:uncharacterized protein LOC131264830 [Anopheles coustani]XP_058170053.1 uncharacterized protein LOC131285210 [Anopheles ziemanni]
MSCASCLHPTADEQVVCSGYCDGVFHLTCAGLSREATKELGKNPQLGWFCSECTEFRSSNKKGLVGELGVLLSKQKDELLTKLNGSFLSLLNNIRAEFTKNAEMLVEATAKQALMRLANSRSLNTPTRNALSAPLHGHTPVLTDSAPKRRLIDRSPPVATPAPPSMALGTAIPPPNIRTVPQVGRTWIYLSRFAPDVTGEDVRSLVTTQVGTDDVIVRRLVRHDREASRPLTFVSYRVGVPAELSGTALLPATWPRGIAFREFIDRPSVAPQPVWRPSQHPLPPQDRPINSLDAVVQPPSPRNELNFTANVVA